MNDNFQFDTYCNPIPLPNYPIGRQCYKKVFPEDYRETADPTVINSGGVWYLYSSCGMAYYSEDLISWKYKKLNTYDIGYAPTVVQQGNRFLMTACGSHLFISDSPLGFFKDTGPFYDRNGNMMECMDDPMIFVDDDYRVYIYWGCGYSIKGAELDDKYPNKLISDIKDVIIYDPTHKWERMGDYNEDPSYSWIEGSYMVKIGETYYLTYSAPGTEWVTYGMGAYKSKSPLNGFEYMETSPFLLQTTGLVRGPGHGSVVRDNHNNLWAFYTCNLCFNNNFERRIGMDPLGLDDNGNIISNGASDTPQFRPGYKKRPYENNSADLISITSHKSIKASSVLEGRSEVYALDDNLFSFWAPNNINEEQFIEVHVSDIPIQACSVRIIWRDVNMKIMDGVVPGPFSYSLFGKNKEKEWTMIVDKHDNVFDMVIEYIPFTSIELTDVKLVIYSAPRGILPGVINFTVFGKNIE